MCSSTIESSQPHFGLVPSHIESLNNSMTSSKLKRTKSKKCRSQGEKAMQRKSNKTSKSDIGSLKDSLEENTMDREYCKKQEKINHINDLLHRQNQLLGMSAHPSN